jgi:membrane AbrB-like protein
VPVVGGLAVCAIGGAVCAWLRMPLPWMIGSMLAMASVQMAGAELEPLPGGRDAGMLIVGTTLGLYFTAPVVHEVSSFWPWFVALGFAAIGFGTVSALVLARLSGSDRATAYFGSMPGGASEMATMGEKYGAAPDRVALAHSMRMLLVVTAFPIGITMAGFSATEEYRPVVVPFDPAGLAILLGLAFAGGLIARRVRLPTAFMMGSLIVSIALTVSGVTLSSVPTPVTNAAQVLLGSALGARFDRSFLVTAPRFLAALVPSVALTMVLATLVGWGLAAGAGVYLGSGLLAAAPGGIAEMAITAKVLRIGVAFVTAAHVVRYVIVVLLTVPVFRLISKRRRA